MYFYNHTRFHLFCIGIVIVVYEKYLLLAIDIRQFHSMFYVEKKNFEMDSKNHNNCFDSS